MKGFAYVGCTALLVAALSGVNIGAQRDTTAAGPTFNHDVAPIIFNTCITCHRPGQVAPMSLMSYRELRPWARAIKMKVAKREMPPWFADARFGHFRNSTALSQQQIDTITAWVDRGAPEGDGPAPTPPALGAGGWLHPSGEPPDMIIEMPFEMQVPAQSQYPWFDLYQDWPFKEDMFLEAVQVLPSNAAVAHHVTAGIRTLKPGTKIGSGRLWPGGQVLSNILVDPEGRSLAELSFSRATRDDTGQTGETDAARFDSDKFGVDTTAILQIYAPPTGFKQFGAGRGKRIPKDSLLYWTVHYTASGRPERDRSRLGLWFQKVPMASELFSALSNRATGSAKIAKGQELVLDAGALNNSLRHPVIPPYDPSYAITSIIPFQDDVTIHLFWPHMHLRGKDMTFIATYPDGREEVLLNVPRYNFNWQLVYELERPVKLPAGSTLRVLSHWDNSARNRENPAPNKEVYWSQQSWDEMLNEFFDYSIDKHDRPMRTSSASSSGR